MKKLYWLFILSMGVLISCKHPQKPLSFYYWKTRFQLNATEKQVLSDNAVTTLYVRYFDIDFEPQASTPAPVSPLQPDNTMRQFNIVPVIFIKNRTFERMDSSMVSWLVKNTLYLVSAISRSQSINPREIQFDCDWTERTRDKYFSFLQQYAAISNQTVSATIRLHQVKYKERTGVPPVQYGVLMYYNIGPINGDDNNSIYEKSVAERYNTYIQSYPLPLDVALPIFSWGITVRDGKAAALLNKIDATGLKNDSNFVATSNNLFLVKHACFKDGYYFKESDDIKMEHVSEADLLDITRQINQYSNHRIGKIIFYDLDSTNLNQYEKTIFEKVRSSIH